MRRRDYLRSAGVFGFGVLAGCTRGTDRHGVPERASTRTATRTRTDTREPTNVETGASAGAGDEPAVRIAYDPYEEVDWGTVSHHRCEFHNHVRGAMDEPADVVDLYHDLGYTVYAVADNGGAPMRWPWTAFSEADDASDDRDPADLGVVAFPGCEFSLDEHVCSLFSTLTHRDVDTGSIDRRWEQAHRIVDRTDEYVPEDVGGLAVVAHPALYYLNPNTAWKRYRADFASRTREQGVVGLEVFNRASVFGRDTTMWDNLLSAFAPDRMIWGFGVDDPQDYELGTDVDVNWTTVLLDGSEFDPGDQPGSRRAAALAMTAGRTLLNRRGQWDPETEAPAPAPRVERVVVDHAGAAITLEASDCDAIEWVSGGAVVATGETVTLSSDHVPYVRAHLSNRAGGETSTQPFGLAAG